MKISSFSPFVISWEPNEEDVLPPDPNGGEILPPDPNAEDINNLPQTGDSSHAALYAVMLTISVIGLAVTAKRRKAE